ncbi:MAG: hydroxymethylbilane synthase [Chitinophagaceae bacterium]|nr:MAG: hydroxymethylbilane synthase [Chitinophagaceae bacterium]
MAKATPIRIGTRESQLALWQAQHVKDLLAVHQIESILVPIKSEGDIDLTTPLYAMGVQGVFTRSLDIALLNDTIDIAVHSMKDVPVQLPKTIVNAAVLSRASYKDIFVINTPYLAKRTGLTEQEVFENIDKILEEKSISIATSSVRRKAQWLAKYPYHTIENIRGNVNTRLQKLAESQWAGAIFAAAGLERIQVRPTFSIDLDWMLPAPAQGAILVVAKESNKEVLAACKLLNDEHTALEVDIERSFLSNLMGGCATPISALAKVIGDHVFLKASVTSLNGTKTLTVDISRQLQEAKMIANEAAKNIIDQGGKELIQKMQDE